MPAGPPAATPPTAVGEPATPAGPRPQAATTPATATATLGRPANDADTPILGVPLEPGYPRARRTSPPHRSERAPRGEQPSQAEQTLQIRLSHPTEPAQLAQRPDQPAPRDGADEPAVTGRTEPSEGLGGTTARRGPVPPAGPGDPPAPVSAPSAGHRDATPGSTGRPRAADPRPAPPPRPTRAPLPHQEESLASQGRAGETAPDAGAPPSDARPAEAPSGPWYRSGGPTVAPTGETADSSDTVGPRRRTRARTVTAASSLVLGLGLLAGAAAGTWLTDDATARPSGISSYPEARAAWHSVPVDALFPRTLRGDGAGPGGADRSWTRIAVAPDSSCAGAFDPLLDKALSPVGCDRLLRATYVDATETSVTTVGLLVTKADSGGMRALGERFDDEKLGERADLMPRPYAAKDTVAAGFGDGQRASWQIHVLTDAPIVVYAVTGFADGRKITDPQAAQDATARGATSVPAQAGLGHDAKGVAAEIERAFRRAVSRAGTDQ